MVKFSFGLEPEATLARGDLRPPRWEHEAGNRGGGGGRGWVNRGEVREGLASARGGGDERKGRRRGYTSLTFSTSD